MLDAHYEQVRRTRGYDPVEVAVGGLSVEAAHRRFAFVEDADALAAATPAETLVSVGVSLTGTPHVGTVGQLATAVTLQRAGFDVQLVLADLVVYNSRGVDLQTVQTRAARYRTLARECGFDPAEGRLVVQSEDPDLARTAFLLAPDYTGERAEPEYDPTAFEKRLDAAYDDVDPGDDVSDLSGELAGLLLVADTVRPLMDDDYERVLLVGGADNVGLARELDAVRARADVAGEIVGLYTRLVPGRDGAPKMSKSLPGSDVNLAMSPGRIREAVVNADDAAADATARLLPPLVPAGSATRDDCADVFARLAEAWRATSATG
ncbi:hypothetical protein [Halorarius halobius]|uniref:hypothetical protein n=1 Tax=Halorarius halobius TaxID=2962671 RepID=UPI0020CF670F|nr:hypothetical protein [Halorarius halobius]